MRPRCRPAAQAAIFVVRAVHFGRKSAARAALIDSDSVHFAERPAEGWAHRWVPPASVHEDDDDYHAFLREDWSL